MTANEARAIAAFLGEPYKVCGGEYVARVEDGEWVHVYSDADLLLAIFTTAQARQLYPAMLTTIHGWTRFDLTAADEAIADGPTPLAAAVAAVVKYQDSISTQGVDR